MINLQSFKQASGEGYFERLTPCPSFL